MKRVLCLLILIQGCTSTDGSVLAISDGQGGSGSGFVVGESPDAWTVLTARHVVLGSEDEVLPNVWIEDQITIYISIPDANVDAAILTVHKRPTDKYKIWATTTETPNKGEAVRMIGWHYDFDEEREAHKSDLITFHGLFVTDKWLVPERGTFFCIQGTTYPGMSGGPAIDAKGRVFGILSRFPIVRGNLDSALALCVPLKQLGD